MREACAISNLLIPLTFTFMALLFDKKTKEKNSKTN